MRCRGGNCPGNVKATYFQVWRNNDTSLKHRLISFVTKRKKNDWSELAYLIYVYGHTGPPALIFLQLATPLPLRSARQREKIR